MGGHRACWDTCMLNHLNQCGCASCGRKPQHFLLTGRLGASSQPDQERPAGAWSSSSGNLAQHLDSHGVSQHAGTIVGLCS